MMRKKIVPLLFLAVNMLTLGCDGMEGEHELANENVMFIETSAEDAGSHIDGIEAEELTRSAAAVTAKKGPKPTCDVDKVYNNKVYYARVIADVQGRNATNCDTGRKIRKGTKVKVLQRVWLIPRVNGVALGHAADVFVKVKWTCVWGTPHGGARYPIETCTNWIPWDYVVEPR
jgi:hypothetical protein